MSAYRRYFDETKDMSFLIKNDELLQKYYKIKEFRRLSMYLSIGNIVKLRLEKR